MGENGPGNPILGVLIACVVASVVLAALGFFLRGRGMLASRNAALVWAILVIVPLFGAGFAMMTKHGVDQATGKTRSGVNEPNVQGAP